MTYDVNGIEVEIEDLKDAKESKYAIRKRLFEYSKKLSSMSIKTNKAKQESKELSCCNSELRQLFRGMLLKGGELFPPEVSLSNKILW